jgi:hypothetical protein
MPTALEITLFSTGLGLTDTAQLPEFAVNYQGTWRDAYGVTLTFDGYVSSGCRVISVSSPC